MSRKTELAKNTAILTVGKLCTQCISFFLLPLYTAILSTEEYGTFDLLVTYSALLLPLVNWQLDQGLFRFMLDYRGNKEEESKLLSTLFKLFAAACFGIVACIIIGSVLIGGMLIGTYYCGNRMIQFAALCITAVYAVLTNVDMLKSGVNLVKSRLGK